MQMMLFSNLIFCASVLAIWLFSSMLAVTLVIHLTRRWAVAPENASERLMVQHIANYAADSLSFVLLLVLMRVTYDMLNPSGPSVWDFALGLLVTFTLTGIASHLAGRWTRRGTNP